MKQPKKLTRRMKEFLSGLELDHNNYRLERQDSKSYTFINLETNKLETYELKKGGR